MIITPDTQNALLSSSLRGEALAWGRLVRRTDSAYNSTVPVTVLTMCPAPGEEHDLLRASCGIIGKGDSSEGGPLVIPRNCVRHMCTSLHVKKAKIWAHRLISCVETRWPLPSLRTCRPTIEPGGPDT